MVKLFIKILLLAALFPHSSKGLAQDCDEIVFGGLDWDSSRFHVAVARFILEKGYQCPTRTVPGSTLPLLTAMAEGDVHILMEVWKSTVANAWGRYEKQGKVMTVGVNIPDAVQGFYVPRYLVFGDKERGIEAKAPNLHSVYDLPKYAHLFKDPEVPTKGRFLNCILGWTCEDNNTKKLKVYGLLEHFTNFRPGTGAALAAEIASNYKNGKPFVTYYWGPTWVMGRFDLYPLKEPAFDPEIWRNFEESKNPESTTEYPISKVYVAAHKPFASKYPEVMSFLMKYQTSNKIVSDALAFAKSNDGATMEDAALLFLKEQTDLWQTWVPEEVSSRVKNSLENIHKERDSQILDLAPAINRLVDHLVKSYGSQAKSLAHPILQAIIFVEFLLTFLPWWVFITLCCILTALLGNFKLTLAVSLSFTTIWLLGLWQLSMQSLALMIIAIGICIVIGLPTGVLMSLSARLRRVMLVFLDAMQTMPSFVYLIPALMLFGLGKVPAVFAAVIYAISPIIRLTDLGLRRVENNIIEATDSMGATETQALFLVKLPLALPTIMAGINQATMLALSMVVISSMIGARGLGEQVLLGIQKLDVGTGFTAGLGIVLLAIILDRVTQSIGRRLDPNS